MKTSSHKDVYQIITDLIIENSNPEPYHGSNPGAIMVRHAITFRKSHIEASTN
jgi:hypothetical protein